eukprot:INCI17692.2.p1 GENE.INCI17692.2~~INCI17692.2.p1  ORF type:complete len:540 (-),score=75.69 INCI17692.2:187-1806(-)
MPRHRRQAKKVDEHHDGGHHCIIPLFVLFLICSLLVLQVSKVERLHKVAHTGQLHFAPNGLVKVGKVGVVRHARATTTAVVIVNSSDIGPNSSAAVAIEQNNAQSVAAEQPIDAPSREVHPVAPIDDSIFGNMHLVTTTLNAHSKMNNKWWLPPGNTDFASLVGGADHAPRSNLDSNLTNVVDEPSGYQQPNPSFVYLEKVKPLCRGSNDGPYPAAPNTAEEPPRIAPSFVLVGGPKGGLRSLFNNLMLHPQTIGPKCADTKFFSSPATIRQGVDYYLRFFPEDTSSKSSQQKKPLVTGEASAEYFQKPHVPKSMNKFLPELKLIASLRNPTDAFISKWLQTIKSDPQRVSEFERTTGRAYDCDNVFHEQRLDFKRCSVGSSEQDPAAMNRNRQCVFKIRNLVSQGVYVDILGAWFDTIPSNRWHVLAAEHMFFNTKEAMNSVADFLGLGHYSEADQGKFVRLGSRNIYDQEGILLDSGSSLTDGVSYKGCTRSHIDDFFRPFNQQLLDLIKDQLPYRFHSFATELKLWSQGTDSISTE